MSLDPVASPGNSTLPASRFGPLVSDAGTQFRLWAPRAEGAELLIDGHPPRPLERGGEGFLEAFVEGVGPGTRYRFRVGDLVFPDLASRQQDGDADGWSIVRAPLAPSGHREPPHPWHETVICEVHVGAATPEGSFSALRERLEHFRDAGYTCLEIMPINEFPGSRNWGYDGTLVFAPECAYGTPDDLRALVDRAHELGLSMILDVVYNHFGETSNFVASYAPEWFNRGVETPWGPGINFDEPMVRQFYYENAAMWVGEYDFDGLRLDAVHEVKTGSRDRFLGELAAAVKAVKPQARLILENVRNSFRWLERDDRNAPQTYLAQWNDDMHHVLTFLVTGEGAMTGYDDAGKDPIADLEKALADGFVHDPTEGDESDGRTRGGDAAKLPPDSFITYVQNHDQIGNRADSKRICERVSPAELDFLHFVKFLAPQIPLCFMGDEGNLTSPFPFFIDLPPEAAKPKAEDRYRQLEEMFHDPVEPGGLPDPNAPSTFEAAKLPWSDYELPEHRAALERFREMAVWRRDKLWPLAASPCLDARTARQGDSIIATWTFEAGELSMALNPTRAPAELDCRVQREPVSTGAYAIEGGTLRLGPWSAVAWHSR
jgi:malto-oligosyltrehalose trehalohydrolase